MHRDTGTVAHCQTIAKNIPEHPTSQHFVPQLNLCILVFGTVFVGRPSFHFTLYCSKATIAFAVPRASSTLFHGSSRVHPGFHNRPRKAQSSRFCCLTWPCGRMAGDQPSFGILRQEPIANCMCTSGLILWPCRLVVTQYFEGFDKLESCLSGQLICFLFADFVHCSLCLSAHLIALTLHHICLCIHSFHTVCIGTNVSVWSPQI